MEEAQKDAKRAREEMRRIASERDTLKLAAEVRAQSEITESRDLQRKELQIEKLKSQVVGFEEKIVEFENSNAEMVVKLQASEDAKKVLQKQHDDGVRGFEDTYRRLETAVQLEKDKSHKMRENVVIRISELQDQLNGKSTK